MQRSDGLWSAAFLQVIGELFKQEREIRTRDLSGCDKLDRCVRHSKAIAGEFWALCDRVAADPPQPPRDPIPKVVAYAQKRRAGLNLFLSDAAVPFATNVT